MSYNRKVKAKYRTTHNTVHNINSPKHRTLQTTGRLIVERTPDLYDKAHGDSSAHFTKALIGNQFMVARNTKRIGKSGLDFIRKHKVNFYRRHNLNFLAKRNERKINPEGQFSLKRSIRHTVSNQSRKGINAVAYNEDVATKAAGKIIKGSWATLKYRKQARQAVVNVTRFIKSLIIGIVTFVTSIPAIIVGVVTSIPAMIILVVICLIMSIFSSYNFYGRVDGLFEYKHVLEQKYNVNINIIDMMSITYALDWYEGSYEMYDRLCSYIYCIDPHKDTEGTDTDFETALERVFKNNNPALNLLNTEEWGIDTNIYDVGTYGYDYQKKINKEWYFDVFPTYSKLHVGSERESYGFDSSIENLKEKARSSKNYNSKLYSDYINELSGFTYGDLNTGTTIEKARYLYPNGVPKNKEEAEMYMINLQVPILNREGNPSVATVKVHKALAGTVLKIYQEMVDIGFRAYDNTCGGTWREIAGGNGAISNHSFGLAFDINVKENPQIGSSGYDTGSANDYDATGTNHLSITQEVANIWIKYGFRWGGNYKNKKDYMHLEYIHGALITGKKY